MKKIPVATVTVLIFVSIMGLVCGAAGARIPNWLVRKREFEAKYEKTAKQEQENRAQEVEKMRAEAPKDEKGNPVIPGEPVSLNLEIRPVEDVRVIERTTTVYLTSPKREGYVFTSEAYAPYNVLIAASDREDSTTGVIFHVTFTPDGMQINEQKFPGNGPIVLESLTDDNNVVTFQWGSSGRGSYDLRNGTAFFEK